MPKQVSPDFYLIRHGESMNGDSLTELGLQQAEQARDILIAEQLGTAALLLSSPSPRAAKTAEIIGQGLGLDIRLVDELASTSDEWIEHLSELDKFVSSIVEREKRDPTLLKESPVIIVSHEPFLSTFIGQKTDLNNGEVVKYRPEKSRLFKRHKSKI